MANEQKEYQGYKPPFTLSARAVGLVADILDGKTVENMVYFNQQAYYDAIAQSTKQGESGPFIEFMLEEIYKSVLQHKGEPLDDTVNDTANDTVKTTPTQEGIIDLVRKNPSFTYDELAVQLGVGRATIARNIAILKDRGVLEHVGEDKNGYWKLNK